jgi:hypothetical protein
MSFNANVSRSIDEVQVVPGATWDRTRYMATKHFQVVVHCRTVNPDSFAATITFDGQQIAETAARPSIEAATNAARKRIRDAFAQLFS